MTAPQQHLAKISLCTYGGSVYEPAEDSFALVDALVESWADLTASPPVTCLEVGCGSGYVITSLALLLRSQRLPAVCYATDINPAAAEAAAHTLQQHGVTSVDVVCGDLCAPLRQRIAGTVDLLVFNPPYVVTPEEEVALPGAAQAWAGGAHGRTVIDRFLPQVAGLLSAHGHFFLVTIAENRPSEILDYLRRQGLSGRVALRRVADEEVLQVLHCWKGDARGAAGLREKEQPATCPGGSVQPGG